MAKAMLTTSAGMIIRQKEPTNLETPLDQVDSYLTPAELFYIRSHFTAPRLELASYHGGAAPSDWFSLWSGPAFIAVRVAVNLLSNPASSARGGRIEPRATR